MLGKLCTVIISFSLTADHYHQGICNAPGTGKVMAELVMSGQISSAKIPKLDPTHFL